MNDRTFIGPLHSGQHNGSTSVALHALRPLSLVEFWWGTSPPVHPRIERTFYSACERKCHPILGFMLQGLDEA